MDYDKTEIAKTYNLGRDLAPDVLRQWMDADKLSMRADSILICLDDAEFEAGIHSFRNETSGGAIVEPIDIVVFEKQQA